MTANHVLELMHQSTARMPGLSAARQPTRRRFLLRSVAAALAVPTFAQSQTIAPGHTLLPALTQPAPDIFPMHRSVAKRLQPSFEERLDWDAFRSRFIMPDGRVTDTSAAGVSHTESQGLGMLFAVAFNDQACFSRIWSWTSRNLRRSSDALHAWRYVPDQSNPVSDTNNATDGDIYIAAGLVRASKLWNVSKYLRSGQGIAHSILKLLVRDVAGRAVLLPGTSGFETEDEVLVNLSYYAFPMLTELQDAFPSSTWMKLLQDGRKIMTEAQFGKWHLPPDWLTISRKDGALSISNQYPPRFSYDAVRIALFAAWDGASRSTLAPFASFWGLDPSKAPAWVDLKSDVCAPYTANGGIIAIARFVGQDSLETLQVRLPAITPADDYYSAALILLSRLALRETVGRLL